MSTTRTPERIEARQLIRSYNLFQTHRQRQLDLWYPERELIDLQDDPKADCWSQHSLVYKKLRELLPFGVFLVPEYYHRIVDENLESIVTAAQEQLLYWHLAQATTPLGEPVEILTICENEDYFWFEHVPEDRRTILAYLLEEERIRYLTRFHLTHEKIEIAFNEIRLVTVDPLLPESERYRFCITDGREYTYQWTQGIWEVTLANPDQDIIDPRDWHYPPVVRRSPRFVQYIDDTAVIREESESSNSDAWTPLPPSSEQNWDLPDPNPWQPTSCTCRREVCNCGYRPDTPPTPEGVVLWAPGNQYLPFHQ